MNIDNFVKRKEYKYSETADADIAGKPMFPNDITFNSMKHSNKNIYGAYAFFIFYRDDMLNKFLQLSYAHALDCMYSNEINCNIHLVRTKFIVGFYNETDLNDFLTKTKTLDWKKGNVTTYVVTDNRRFLPNIFDDTFELLNKQGMWEDVKIVL